ncbi:MAG TPA: hypothetical protein VFI00_07325 [Kribbella sp.]|nr:hypothetical protein [Kribbella sp.]
MVRRTLALLVALFAVAALGATPAHAGGPTSVLLSAPPHVLAVGYEDQAYGDLQRLTEITGHPVAGGDAGDHIEGRFVRATWLIHDMSVWRIDIIYPDAPGGPWIATSELSTTGSMPEKPTWHTSTDRAALLKLLGSFKLLNGQDLIDGPTTLDVVPQPSPEPATEQPPAAAQPLATAQAASPGAFTGWRWIIPGFLVGAVVAVLAVRLLPRRRWELIDAE